ncbi:WxL domain-containing protein [Carnobacterium divergens]|uniref:WxL domain-containing protein n=1 Tax=Carnobacterium divergens TaxID=2748 RepID=A0A7Z8G5W9_CARDV|nr:WxL domain-containing protein [Carnobacterium divergens]TFI73896.1 hypothetical protein CKN58_04840 [Carnobacterium divergens]TFI77866.1 hypothetical protein CKN85_04835 [Carnobacterium divergens]TFI84707.1 hypothetical protein CKN56_04810 [Carnobacterium divergens]TFI96746.1 hypothetical protein CKN64_04810 [Carnobacterium divergens]TFJ12693.1 hypothetical protein CKN60_04880 [Carnobacterium divergens]
MKKLVIASLSLGVLGLVGTPFASAADLETKGTTGQVEFTEGKLTIDDGKGSFGGGLPSNLDFGKHAIQNEVNEEWTATTDGTTVTTGSLNVSDKRGSSAGWTVKAKQNAQFSINSVELKAAALTIKTGEATNVGGVLPTVGAISMDKELPINADVDFFGAKVNTGAGDSHLALNEFRLAVPAASEKRMGVYTTSITWTLSDTPAI